MQEPNENDSEHSPGENEPETTEQKIKEELEDSDFQEALEDLGAMLPILPEDEVVSHLVSSLQTLENSFHAEDFNPVEVLKAGIRFNKMVPYVVACLPHLPSAMKGEMEEIHAAVEQYLNSLFMAYIQREFVK